MFSNQTDFELVSPPADSISSISFSPKANFLAATSWDNQIRVWEVVGQNRTSVAKAQQQSDQPLLAASWSGDGSKIFFAGCDSKATCWDLNAQKTSQVAAHQAPIKSCIWIEESNVLATASWDKTLKYWDCRQPNPAAQVTLPERAYSMDVRHPLAVVATAEKHICIYNLANPNAEFKRITSPLKYQTRVVSCFPTKNGFAVGSIEGRVAIHHVEDKDQADNFAFKCHRENNTDLYAVNSISFHPLNTFATAGSDGTFNFWDKDLKQRLKPFPKTSGPIPAASFNNDGTLYAYAASYDWHKGVEHYAPNSKHAIYIHPVVDVEIRPRPPQPGQGRNSRNR
jgi:mRNA export factor